MVKEGLIAKELKEAGGKARVIATLTEKGYEQGSRVAIWMAHEVAVQERTLTEYSVREGFAKVDEEGTIILSSEVSTPRSETQAPVVKDCYVIGIQHPWLEDNKFTGVILVSTDGENVLTAKGIPGRYFQPFNGERRSNLGDVSLALTEYAKTESALQRDTLRV